MFDLTPQIKFTYEPYFLNSQRLIMFHLKVKFKVTEMYARIFLSCHHSPDCKVIHTFIFLSWIITFIVIFLQSYPYFDQLSCHILDVHRVTPPGTSLY